MLNSKIILIVITSSIPTIHAVQYSNETDVDHPQRYQSENRLVHNATADEIDCASKTRPCLRKCCAEGQHYRRVNGTRAFCAAGSDGFEPAVRIDGVDYSASSSDFHYIYEVLECPRDQFRTLASELDDEYYLGKDGNLYLHISNETWEIRNITYYCMDVYVIEQNGVVTRDGMATFICMHPDPLPSHQPTINAKMICMPISCVFILLTMAVYVFVPELLNLNGLVLMAYLLSLFVGFCLLTAREYMRTFEKLDNLTSLILIFLIYYIMMVTFFWLNVICYDVWAGFRRSRVQLVEIRTKWSRFGKYSLYAFGVPTAMTALLISLEFSGHEDYSYMPQIRKQGYYLIGPPRFIYFYGPLTILISTNITFFVLTILRITKVRRETGTLLNSDFHSHRIDTDRFFIYIKLFVIMGINWLLEVASVIYEEPTEVWKYIDIYNIFTGLAIFLLFVCKKNTLKLFRKRYYPESNLSLRFQTSITRLTEAKGRMLLRSTTMSSEN